MNSDCRGTSILVDIEEQRTHLSSCPKKLESRKDKRKIIFLHQKSGSRVWIPEAGNKKVSSTIAPTLETVSNAYMEALSSRRQLSPQEERFETLDS